MKFNFCAEEIEMLSISVEERILTWRSTLDFLETGFSERLIEECHTASEAKWQVSRYEALLVKLKQFELS